MVRLWIPSTLVAFLSHVLCLGTARSVIPARSYFVKFVAANNDFARKFLTGARDLTNQDNVFVSPFSVMAGLGMLSIAAHGHTKEEILQVMQVDDWGNKHVADGLLYLSETGRAANYTNYTLSTANRVWSEKSVRVCRTFERRMRKLYAAPMERLDLLNAPEVSREVVNEWVRNQTGGNIQKLLPSGSVSHWTRLVLTNAIYFHGTWESQFDPKYTSPMVFHTCKGMVRGRTNVPTMYHLGEFAMKRSTEHEVDVLEMPYAGGDISMFLLLPLRRACLAIKHLEDKLSAEVITELISNLKFQDLELYLPQFDLNFNAPLSEILKGMGMTQAFDTINADLSGIDCGKDSNNMSVSGAFHQAHVVVNEMGTEASAATGVNMGSRTPPHILKFNRPFLFLIINKHTGAVLFIGRIVTL